MSSPTPGAESAGRPALGPADDIPVGKHLGTHHLEITDELVARFRRAAADDHPWYSADTPFGDPLAPALIACQEPWRFGGWYPEEVRGNLHIRQEWDLWQPLLTGATYQVASVVADRYLRRDRHVIVNEVLVAGADGRQHCRGRTHQAFLRAAPDGDVVGRDRERDPGRRIEPGAGEALERIDGPWVELTPERCFDIADGQSNYHTDREIARAMGFPEVVVQGVFNLNLVSALLTRRFEAGWWCGGKLDVRLVNVIWGGDRVRARAAVREVADEAPRRRAHLEVWVEKPDGVVTAIGSASAVTPAA